MSHTREAIQTANKTAFLAAFRQTGVVGWAANSVPVDRKTVSNWRKADPEFDAAFLSAEEDAADRLEQEAFRRAHDGVRKYVISRGALVMVDDGAGGTTPLIEHVYGDTLMHVLLRARRPDKFRDRASVEHTGKDGGPIQAIGITTNDPVEAARIYQKLVNGT